MKFTLVYEGIVKSDAKAKATHKHKIREVFHQQLEVLWSKKQMQSQHKYSIGTEKDVSIKSVREVNDGYYLPVISEKQGLLADISIRWHRYEPPGSLLQAGDIDNRLKTLLDCLQTPPLGQAIDLGADNTSEKPFYTVLDDDALISDISVNTVQDLRPCSERNNVLLLIEVRPIVVTHMPFGNNIFL